MGKFNVTESVTTDIFTLTIGAVRDKLMEITQEEYESIDFTVLKDIETAIAGEDLDDYYDDENHDYEYDEEDTLNQENSLTY
jgi:hypothetical protein